MYCTLLPVGRPLQASLRQLALAAPLVVGLCNQASLLRTPAIAGQTAWRQLECTCRIGSTIYVTIYIGSTIYIVLMRYTKGKPTFHFCQAALHIGGLWQLPWLIDPYDLGGNLSLLCRCQAWQMHFDELRGLQRIQTPTTLSSSPHNMHVQPTWPPCYVPAFQPAGFCPSSVRLLLPDLPLAYSFMQPSWPGSGICCSVQAVHPHILACFAAPTFTAVSRCVCAGYLSSL